MKKSTMIIIALNTGTLTAGLLGHFFALPLVSTHIGAALYGMLMITFGYYVSEFVNSNLIKEDK